MEPRGECIELELVIDRASKTKSFENIIAIFFRKL
jgi:hypothetical protein